MSTLTLTRPMATLDQRRAAHAWAAIAAAKALERSDRDKFGIHAKKLPTRIMASGLGQALAFLLAKKYAPLLVQTINHWVLKREPFPRDNKELGRAAALVETIVQGDATSMRRHTAETLAYLQWLIRFAEAEGLTDKVDVEGGNP